MLKKTRKSGNVGTMRFVFTNFQAYTYGISSGDDEGNCVYSINTVGMAGVRLIKTTET